MHYALLITNYLLTASLTATAHATVIPTIYFFKKGYLAFLFKTITVTKVPAASTTMTIQIIQINALLLL